MKIYYVIIDDGNEIVVRYLSTKEEAERKIKELINSGYDINDITLIEGKELKIKYEVVIEDSKPDLFKVGDRIRNKKNGITGIIERTYIDGNNVWQYFLNTKPANVTHLSLYFDYWEKADLIINNGIEF